MKTVALTAGIFFFTSLLITSADTNTVGIKRAPAENTADYGSIHAKAKSTSNTNRVLNKRFQKPRLLAKHSISQDDSAAVNTTFTVHSCDANSACGGFGICDAKSPETCRCQAGYQAVGKQCAKTSFTLSPRCLDDEACGLNAMCVQEKCVCRIDHLVPADVERCEAASFPDSACSVSGGCSGRRGVCQAGQCYCQHGYFAVARMCVKASFKPHQGCTVDADCGPHALCGFECRCVDGFFALGRQCVTTSFKTKACTGVCGGGGGRCERETCHCKEGYLASRDTCVAPTFKPSGGCRRAEPCGEGHGVCEADGMTCRCQDGHFAHNGLCVQEAYEDSTCGSYRVFACGGGAGHCSRVGASCVCNAGYVASQDMCVTTTYTTTSGNCSGPQPCGPHATCHTKADPQTCGCHEGFVAVGRQCGRRHFTLPLGCVLDADCGEHAACLSYTSTGICVCQPGFFVSGQRCVQPSFPQPNCTLGQHQVCGGGNGQCLGDQCHCDAGFYVSGDVCMPGDGLQFSEETCHQKDTGCSNGICRSPNADRRYLCLCHSGFAPYVGHTEQVRLCVKRDTLPLPAAQVSSSHGNRSNPNLWILYVLADVLVLAFNAGFTA